MKFKRVIKILNICSLVVVVFVFAIFFFDEFLSLHLLTHSKSTLAFSLIVFLLPAAILINTLNNYLNPSKGSIIGLVISLILVSILNMITIVLGSGI